MIIKTTHSKWKFLASLLLFTISLNSIIYANESESQILLRGAKLILTMDPDMGQDELGILTDADILLSNDTIIAIGPDLSAKTAHIIDVEGKIIMPGFVDIHDHLFQSVMHGCGGKEDIIGWLDTCIYTLYGEDFLSEADAYAGVTLGSLELINSGVTTVADWSSAFSKPFIKGNLRALDDSGMRYHFAYKVGAVNPEIIEDINITKAHIDSKPLATLQLSPVPGTRGPFQSAVTVMTKMAKKLGLQLHIHLHEGKNDRNNGQIESLIKANALGPDLIAAHAVHLTDAEINLLSKYDVRLAYNPVSNMRIGSGVMRLPELFQAGIKVGLGLDGGAVSSGDMFNTLRAAIGLQRAVTMNTNTVPNVFQLLQMSTTGGAEILGMSDKVGSLTPGKKADLIIINPNTINFSPEFDLIEQIVFNTQPINVEWVFINGRPLKQNGQLINTDIDEIIYAAQLVTDKIKKRISTKTNDKPD